MAKKQADRRTDEKPAKPNPAEPDVTRDATRGMTEGADIDKGFKKPDGAPIDKRLPKPGREDRGIFEGDRSDRESGRPIQLDDDDAEPAVDGGRTHEGYRESEKTRR